MQPPPAAAFHGRAATRAVPHLDDFDAESRVPTVAPAVLLLMSTIDAIAVIGAIWDQRAD